MSIFLDNRSQNTLLSLNNNNEHYFKLLFLLAFLVNPFSKLNAKTDTIKNGNQTIQVDYSNKFNPSELQKTEQWLKTVTDSLLMVYGEWPKDEFEIIVRSTKRGRGPVPWGQVNRDDPDRVSLYINPDYGFDAVEEDWTAYHELSHLLIPYRGYGDLWISEGLASYYQNIIQARSGKLNEKQFWDQILSGFERGKRQTNWSNKRLSTVSDNMRRYRNHMRVHWSGVLFWLTADMQIREQSNNKQSLDSLLKQLKNCCERQDMSSLAIMKKLDQLYGENVFTPLFYTFRDSYQLPEYQSLLNSMGIEKNNRWGRLKINEDARLADISQQIYLGNLQK